MILTGILSGLSQIVGKRQVDRMGSFQAGVLRDVTVLIIVSVMCIQAGGVKLEWAAGAIFAFGVMESVSIAAYFAAQREHMSATAVFGYPFSQLLIVLFAGIFFQEWKYFDVRHLQGIFNVVALIATMGLMFVYQGGATAIKGKFRWNTMLMFSAVVVAISNIESKWAVTSLGYTPATAMLYEFCGIVAGGIGYVTLRKQGMKIGAQNMMWGVLQGTLLAASALWYMQLLMTSPLTISSLVRRVAIVLSVVAAGMFGYGEAKTMNRRQIWIICLGLLIFGLVIGVNG